MDIFLGSIFLFLIFVFIFFWKKNHSEVLIFLLVAFFLRAGCVVLYQSITLPDGIADEITFLRAAREFSYNEGLSVFFDLWISDNFLVSRFISLFFSIFGDSYMMAQSLSVAFGTACVYLVYKLCLMIWDKRSAKKAAWITTFFPTLVLYSALTLREVYIVFFLLIALIGIVKFERKKNAVSLLQILISFYILNLFHGGAAIGGIIFLFYQALIYMKKILIMFMNLYTNLSALLLIPILITPVIMLVTDNLKITYLPSLYDLDFMRFYANVNMYSTGSYPSWLRINENYELFTKVFIRAIYFLYSPFFWDIRLPHQVIGLLDSTLYLVLTIYLIKNWRVIWANPITRIFVLLFIGYIIVHAIGVGNFGTSIRHRSKFVVILIVLAAPKIHKFIIRKE